MGRRRARITRATRMRHDKITIKSDKELAQKNFGVLEPSIRRGLARLDLWEPAACPSSLSPTVDEVGMDGWLSRY